MDTPTIAVLGSARVEILDDDAVSRAAKALGEALGRELAQAGFRIVVYSSRPDFIEADVVRGFVGAAGNEKNRIVVRYPQDIADTVKFEEEASQSDMFERIADADPDWQASFYRSLPEADGIVMLGGGESTLIAGHIALSLNIPIIAIANFGGAAGKIWQRLSYEEEYKDSSDLRQMAVDGELSASVCVAGLKQRIENKRESAAKSVQDHNQLLAKAHLLDRLLEKRNHPKIVVALLVIFMTLVVTGLTIPTTPTVAMWFFIFGLASSSSCGASIRLLWRRELETSVSATIVLGAVAGVFTGLAYLAPQWIGDSTFLELNRTIDPKDRILFITVLLAAFSAGLGFDIVLDKWKNSVAERVGNILEKSGSS